MPILSLQRYNDLLVESLEGLVDKLCETFLNIYFVFRPTDGSTLAPTVDKSTNFCRETLYVQRGYGAVRTVRPSRLCTVL